MAPPPVKNTYDLASIAVREPFYVRRNSDTAQIAAMMVVPAVMLIVNPDGSMDTVMPSMGGRQRSWQFVRYFTEDETLTIAGSMPGEGREALPEVDVSDLPTQDKVRKSRSTEVIPDGVYFRIRGGGGSDYICVNCPPRKSYTTMDVRRMALVGVSTNYLQDTSVDLTANSGWEFIGYVMPEDVPEKLKPFPKK